MQQLSNNVWQRFVCCKPTAPELNKSKKVRERLWKAYNEHLLPVID